MPIQFISNDVDKIDFNVSWYVPEKRVSAVKLTKAGITISKEILESLKDPKHVMVGFDLTKRVVVIKPCEECANSFTINYLKGSNRFGNAKLINFIASQFGLKMDNWLSYRPNIVEDQNLVYIKIDDNINK